MIDVNKFFLHNSGVTNDHQIKNISVNAALVM